jgi:hypothetical protein
MHETELPVEKMAAPQHTVNTTAILSPVHTQNYILSANGGSLDLPPDKSVVLGEKQILTELKRKTEDHIYLLDTV